MIEAEAWVYIACAVSIFAAVLAVLYWRERSRRKTLDTEREYAASARQLAARGEAAERARARFYREILDALPAPIWRRSDDLNLVYCNDAYAQAAGAVGPAEALLDNRELGGLDARRLADELGLDRSPAKPRRQV